MTRVAVLTPLPPSRTGIAHYASMLVPALAKELDVAAFASLDGYRRADFDRVVYQLGNNPHHEWIYEEALREPGIIVLHDLVLHHLIVEMTLARGDAEGYVATLARSHGEAGAAWARGRAAGLHSEMGNFLLPASIDIAQHSRGVIVHNHYAAERLRSFGVTTPIHVVPHPYIATGELLPPAPPHTIGFFGFLTSAKRAEVVLEAFAIARRREPRLQLLIVGEPAPNIDISQLLGEGVTATGYVDDDAFGAYYAKVDRLVNLRYPSAGETSGTLIRAFDAGKPVAVSNYAQFAEFPDHCVVKVPLGEGEVDALVEFFLRDFDAAAVARAQRAWLESNATLEKCVAGYRAALDQWEQGGAQPSHLSYSSHSSHRVLPSGAVALFPHLTVVSTAVTSDTLTLTLRNDGTTTLRTRSYGEPGYRLLVKLFDGDVVVQDRWLELPGDVAPEGIIEVTLRVDPRAKTLRLYHALESIPMLEPEPWSEVALVR
ncbi:MAG TPA: glycosyltransferase family 4 protein [Thermoanaerobaculia bacterium]